MGCTPGKSAEPKAKGEGTLLTTQASAKEAPAELAAHSVTANAAAAPALAEENAGMRPSAAASELEEAEPLRPPVVEEQAAETRTADLVPAEESEVPFPTEGAEPLRALVEIQVPETQAADLEATVVSTLDLDQRSPAEMVNVEDGVATSVHVVVEDALPGSGAAPVSTRTCGLFC